MIRTSQWLAVLGTACVAACYSSGVVAGGQPPADNSPAQLPAETSRAASPSGLTLTCEMFCSQTKLRTGNARLRWTMAAADRAQSRVLSLATAKQTLEFSVYGQEFEKDLVATLPISSPTARGVAGNRSGQAPRSARVSGPAHRDRAAARPGASRCCRRDECRDRRPGARSQLFLARRDRSAEGTTRLLPRHLPGTDLPGRFHKAAAMSALRPAMLVIVSCLTANSAYGQMTVVVRDISPDRSSSDAANPNGASGGRVNGLGVDRTTPARVYRGERMGRSLPEQRQRPDLGTSRRPRADGDVGRRGGSDRTRTESMRRRSIDGRTNSRAGINVSTDGGTTWTQSGDGDAARRLLYQRDLRRTEPAAFGICGRSRQREPRVHRHQLRSRDEHRCRRDLDLHRSDARQPAHGPSGTSSSTTAASSTSAATTGIVVRPMAARPGRRRPGRRCSRCRPAAARWRSRPTRTTSSSRWSARQSSRPTTAGRAGRTTTQTPRPRPHSVCRHQSARRRHLRSVVRRRQPAPRRPARRRTRRPPAARSGATLRRLGKRDHRRPQRLGRYRVRAWRRHRRLSHAVLVGWRRLSQPQRQQVPAATPRIGSSRRSHRTRSGTTPSRVAPRPARGPRTSISATRTPARSATTNGGGSAGDLDERAVLRRLRRRRRATRALTTVCCFGPGRATRMFVSGAGTDGATDRDRRPTRRAT